MMIYNQKDLDNRLLQQQAEDAYKQGIISKETYTSAVAGFPCGLYTPNIIIRFALGLLTIVCISFGSVLLGAMFFSVYTFLFLLLAAGCYVALELLIKHKNHYNAGIDNILQLGVLIFFLLVFVDAKADYLEITMSVVVLMLSGFMCLRFTDAFMGAISYAALIATSFYAITYILTNGLLIIPFVVMALSTIISLIVLKSINKPALKYYRFCLQVVLIMSVISLYASGNVYVVMKLAALKDMNLMAPGNTVVISFLWCTTALVPIACFWYGFVKKDLLFLRCGYVLLAASIITFDYFYFPAAAEIHMISAGAAMLLISFLCIRYFKPAKQGFTSLSNSTLNKKLGWAQTLISIQVAAHSTTAVQNTSTEYGGGSSGGAGAAGEW